MKVKGLFKSIIKAIVFCLLLFTVLSAVTRFLMAPNSPDKYGSFFSEPHDFDVLFMGNSHVINAVYPMELFRDFGIVSYNLSNHASSMGVTYHTLKNALDYTTPKLVVVDLSAVCSEERWSSSGISYAHTALDAFPLTFNKFTSVMDLFQDDSLETKMEMLFPLILYHTQWETINSSSFAEHSNIQKGAEPRYHLTSHLPEATIQTFPDNAPETLGMYYARKILSLCDSKGIQVLYVNIPNDYNHSQYDRQVAPDRADVRYIDLQTENVVDYNVDFYDASHLNPSGAQKVTAYLGEYISKNYQLPDRRQDASYADWVEQADVYYDSKWQTMQYLHNLNEVLTVLADDDFSIEVLVNSDRLTLESIPTEYAQVQNIPIYSYKEMPMPSGTDLVFHVRTLDEATTLITLVYSLHPDGYFLRVT